MKALHKIAAKPSHIESIEIKKSSLAAFDEQCTKLRNYLTSLLSPERQKSSFEMQEEEISKLTFEIGRAALSMSLSQYDKLTDVIIVGNQSYRKTISGKKRYQTCLGEVEVERHCYKHHIY